MKRVWEDGINVVLFTGSHCSECVPVKERWSRIAKESFPGLHWRIIDPQKETKLSRQCFVKSIPAIRVLQVSDGEVSSIDIPGNLSDNYSIGEKSLHELLKGVIGGNK